MKTLRLYATKTHNNYGGAVNLNGLKLFDTFGRQMEVVVLTKARNKGTFSANGVNGTITCPNIYVNSSYYYTPYIFNAVGTAYTQSIYMRDQTAKIATPIESNAGVLLTFEENVKISKIEVSGCMDRNVALQVIIDEGTSREMWSEVCELNGKETISIEMPALVFCIRGKNGLLYFRKPKVVENG